MATKKNITFTIDEDGSSGGFHSELLISGQTTDGGAPLLSFDGRWLIGDGLILTAIAAG